LQEIKEKLFQLQEKEYQVFASSLIPKSKPLIGVRIPLLRKFAKEIAAKKDWIDFLETGAEDYFEELMLKALVIGYAKADTEVILRQAEVFIPKIADWSINDSFCSNFQIAKKNPKRVWEFLMNYIDSQEEFTLRMVAVMLMDYYLNEEYIDSVLKVYHQISPVGYYTQMGVAWAVATAYAKFPEKVLEFLKDGQLDSFTYQKAITKMLESRRISDQEKEKLQKMRKEIP